MSAKLNDMTFRDLELRHLHALRAVANEGTFARAGQLLGFTQSAISQQISGLERAIGSPVFDRLGGARGAQLTPIGHLLLEHAHRILGSVETAEHALQSFQSGIDGSLVIGTFQSMSVRVLPAVLGRLRQEWPGLEIRLFESDEQSILTEQLRAGELDLTFAVYPLLGDDLAFEDLCAQRRLTSSCGPMSRVVRSSADRPTRRQLPNPRCRGTYRPRGGTQLRVSQL